MKNTVTVSKIQMWPLERFVPYTQNPRTHPDWQIQQIADIQPRISTETSGNQKTP